MFDPVDVKRQPVIGPNTDDGPYAWSWHCGSDAPQLVQVDWLPGQRPPVLPRQSWES